MIPAAVADVVVVFLRLTFESKEPRGKEKQDERRRGRSDLSAAKIMYFEFREREAARRREEEEE